MNRKAFIVSAMMVFVMVLLLMVAPASAGGATQISGTGYFDEAGDCTDFETGPGKFYEFALKMTGDLDGCHYVHIDTWQCSPSGTYRERGSEIFVGEYEGQAGTFETTYLVSAKLEDCPDLATEIWGRCQHPIAAGSGKGDFAGVTGRFDIKDDLVAGNFPYKGHLQW